MSVSAPRATHCDFCAGAIEETNLLFVSELGGLPPVICDACVLGFAEVVIVYQRSPELASQLVAALNARIDAQRRGEGR